MMGGGIGGDWNESLEFQEHFVFQWKLNKNILFSNENFLLPLKFQEYFEVQWNILLFLVESFKNLTSSGIISPIRINWKFFQFLPGRCMHFILFNLKAKVSKYFFPKQKPYESLKLFSHLSKMQPSKSLTSCFQSSERNQTSQIWSTHNIASIHPRPHLHNLIGVYKYFRMCRSFFRIRRLIFPFASPFWLLVCQQLKKDNFCLRFRPKNESK